MNPRVRDMLGKIVVLRTAPGEHQETVRVHSIADFPTLEGTTADGRSMTWALHLARLATDQEAEEFHNRVAAHAARNRHDRRTVTMTPPPPLTDEAKDRIWKAVSEAMEYATRPRRRRRRYAIVELMGHAQIAGIIERTDIGLFRITVPRVGDEPAFETDIGPAAIYRIRFVSRDEALVAAERIQARRIPEWLRINSDDLPF